MQCEGFSFATACSFHYYLLYMKATVAIAASFTEIWETSIHTSLSDTCVVSVKENTNPQ